MDPEHKRSVAARILQSLIQFSKSVKFHTSRLTGVLISVITTSKRHNEPDFSDREHPPNSTEYVLVAHSKHSVVLATSPSIQLMAVDCEQHLSNLRYSLVEICKKHEIFQTHSCAQLDQLIMKMVPLRMTVGDVLFHVGEQGSDMFVLQVLWHSMHVLKKALPNTPTPFGACSLPVSLKF